MALERKPSQLCNDVLVGTAVAVERAISMRPVASCSPSRYGLYRRAIEVIFDRFGTGQDARARRGLLRAAKGSFDRVPVSNVRHLEICREAKLAKRANLPDCFRIEWMSLVRRQRGRVGELAINHHIDIVCDLIHLAVQRDFQQGSMRNGFQKGEAFEDCFHILAASCTEKDNVPDHRFVLIR